MNLPEWWGLLENNMVDIRNLILEFHSRSGMSPREMKITAKVAEIWRKQFANLIRSEKINNPIQEFDQLVTQRDHLKIINLLNEVWFGIPESRSARELPGFFVLCDLCSDLQKTNYFTNFHRK